MEFPLNFGLYKTGLPLILTSGKLKNVCFLIDTGSTHNFIFSFVYEHFKDEFHTLKETQKTMGIEGNFQVCKTVEATFNFEGTEYTSTFAIVDATSAMSQVQEETDVQIHGVLGIQFLLENKWRIDFEKRTVSCP
ncbi:MAG: retropepsin-like aspartic protease [Agathobacter sp.]